MRELPNFTPMVKDGVLYLRLDGTQKVIKVASLENLRPRIDSEMWEALHE